MCNVPYGLQPAISGLANQELLPTSYTLFWIQSCMVSNQNIWPHQTATCKLQTYPNNKCLASLQTNFGIIPCMSFDVTLPFRHCK